MEQAIEQLDVLIISVISSHHLEPHKHSPDHTTQLGWKAISACEDLRKSIGRRAEGGGSPEDFGLFIHNSQATVTDFLDHVYQYRLAATTPELVSLYNKVELGLLDVFYLFKDRHTVFFNTNARIPLKYQQEYKDILQYSLPYIRAQLAKKLPGSELPAIALEPLELFLGEIDSNELTYRFMAYVKRLYQELDQWAGCLLAVEDHVVNFISLLAKMNVNSDACCAFWRAHLSVQLEKAAGPWEAMELLDDYSRTLCLTVTIDTMGYRPGVMPLKTYLQETVATEMAIAEKAWLAMQLSRSSVIDKLMSAFSVKLEGVWLRAGIHAGRWAKIEFNKAMTTLSAFVGSKDQPDMSVASMRGKSRPKAGIKDWEKDLLIGILHKMLQYVRGLPTVD